MNYTFCYTYKISTPLHVGLSRFQEVDEPSRSGYTYFTAILQVPDLRALGGTPIHTGTLHVTGAAKGLSNRLHLQSQFPGWGKNQYLKCVCVCVCSSSSLKKRVHYSL